MLLFHTVAMVRRLVPPLLAGWVIVDGLPMFHRVCLDAGPDAVAIVHVHGFGISGTYLEPTAARARAPPQHVRARPAGDGTKHATRPHPSTCPGLAKGARLVLRCRRPRAGRSSSATRSAVRSSSNWRRRSRNGSSAPCRCRRRVARTTGHLPRAIRQMAVDGLREPFAMLPIAVRDYLRFGAIQSVSLFRAMTQYPTLERLHNLAVPTLVIAGAAGSAGEHRPGVWCSP